ncbi:hypothetical protein KIPB_001870 [Kipferlia bialata]|uniref:Uncharacterized protein n=1 Tax=Kipferlia bialata TaxID=797122 RepID=A0A9K3GG92_9EUKA|nr:hypothetical protein KIPB_001870 [Kipferlia bialata]|eukprot:g1870.t1
MEADDSSVPQDWAETSSVLVSLVETIWATLDPSNIEEAQLDDVPELSAIPELLAMVDETIQSDPTPQRLRFLLFELPHNLIRLLCTLMSDDMYNHIDSHTSMQDVNQTRTVSMSVLSRTFSVCSSHTAETLASEMFPQLYASLSTDLMREFLKAGGLNSVISVLSGEVSIDVDEAPLKRIRLMAAGCIRAVLKSDAGLTALSVPPVMQALVAVASEEADAELRQWALVLLRDLTGHLHSSKVFQSPPLLLRAVRTLVESGTAECAIMSLCLDTSEAVRAEGCGLLSELLLAAEDCVVSAQERYAQDVMQAQKDTERLLAEREREGADPDSPAPVVSGPSDATAVGARELLDRLLLSVISDRTRPTLDEGEGEGEEAQRQFSTALVERMGLEKSRIGLEALLYLLCTLLRVSARRAQSSPLTLSLPPTYEAFCGEAPSMDEDAETRITEAFEAFIGVLLDQAPILKMLKLVSSPYVVIGAHAARCCGP